MVARGAEQSDHRLSDSDEMVEGVLEGGLNGVGFRQLCGVLRLRGRCKRQRIEVVAKLGDRQFQGSAMTGQVGEPVAKPCERALFGGVERHYATNSRPYSAASVRADRSA